MKFIIRHDIRGRLRVHFVQQSMTYRQADTLVYYLEGIKGVTSAKVYERTADAVICYSTDRADIIKALKSFSYGRVDVPENYLQNSGRELNAYYQEQLICRIIRRMASKLFLPVSIRNVITAVKAVKYIWRGIKTLSKGRIEVPVLDATAIGVSVFRKDFTTAGSVMFLLGIGELLEEWTHKKSVDDLARSMSLNIDKVWVIKEGVQVQIPASKVCCGDSIVVNMGSVIPFDGVVTDGEGMVNQAALTGESNPVRKTVDGYVYAGTVLEEGELTVCAKSVDGNNKYQQITAMIEQSEKLKSSLESKAEHLADRLVPYTLAGTALVYLFTRNITKALSVLMVDFSCALKLSMPVSVLSAIREASGYNVTVKGGKFLEAMAEADTIVFDKTGTLTKAAPTVVDVVSFDGRDSDELLCIAACMEEHFPHSIAKAVVDAAIAKGLVHDEMHSKVEYIVAHGISTTIDGKKAVIGSYHFVFEDEKCVIPDGMEDKFNSLPEECSHLYLAIENKLAAVICIDDPMRDEAAFIVRQLKEAGIDKIVMMTGDSERTAKAIAAKVGVDEYYSEVLPEDKAHFIEKEKAAGRRVVMIGDGINDTPALSAADIGIAINDGAQIAREIADVTIGSDNLSGIVVFKQLSTGLMKRINRNYRTIVGFNSGLILLGVLGIIAPTTSALLHNTSTLVIGLNSMKDILVK